MERRRNTHPAIRRIYGKAEILDLFIRYLNPDISQQKIRHFRLLSPGLKKSYDRFPS
jgi:hypothetical protein